MQILVVDDSSVARGLLRAVFEAAGYSVIEAVDGQQALLKLSGLSTLPQLITMDVHMPGDDGYKVTEAILKRYSLPIIVVTASANSKDAKTAILALAAGALAVVEKPKGPSDDAFEAECAQLLHTIRRFTGSVVHLGAAIPQSFVLPRLAWRGKPKLVVIGASAGGPAALRDLLLACDADLPWPIVVVQHIAAGFTDSFVEWMGEVTRKKVSIASSGERLIASQVYVAPEGVQIEISSSGVVRLCDSPARENWRPSVSYLFEQTAIAFGANAIGILLSGMGKDGAEGLKKMKDAGALTLIQDPDTAMINGMPNAAFLLGAATEVLAPSAIAKVLNSLKAHVLI